MVKTAAWLKQASLVCTDQPASTARTSVDTGHGAIVKLVDEFCYLGNVLRIDDADTAAAATAAKG